MEEKKKHGGQTSYTEALGRDVCLRMANGQGLVQICRELGLPGMSTIFSWIYTQPSFAEDYARARDNQADAMDSMITDVAQRVDAGLLKPDAGRVIMDAYKWRAERLKPKVYGAQGQVTHVSTSEVKRLEEDELRTLKAQLLAPVIDQAGNTISPKRPTKN